MFTVSGSQVFEAAAAGFVPSYGAGSATIDATGGSVKARRALQSQPKEQLIFSFFAAGRYSNHCGLLAGDGGFIRAATLRGPGR
jgi:hypothetical protein